MLVHCRKEEWRRTFLSRARCVGAVEEGDQRQADPFSQFLTQNEPAFCALGTLCMILNTLGVDPQRQWKSGAPWRWYEQEMLDCCRPLTAVATSGLTLAEFGCLARCNGLQASILSPPLEGGEEALREAKEVFRREVRESAQGKEGVMAISYSRRSLGQTGDGHFSPVAGYNEKEDMVSWSGLMGFGARELMLSLYSCSFWMSRGSRRV